MYHSTFPTTAHRDDYLRRGRIIAEHELTEATHHLADRLMVWVITQLDDGPSRRHLQRQLGH